MNFEIDGPGPQKSEFFSSEGNVQEEQPMSVQKAAILYAQGEIPSSEYLDVLHKHADTSFRVQMERLGLL